MLADDANPVAVVSERVAMRGKHQFDVKALNPCQRLQVIIQRISARLRVQTDVGTDLWQEVIAGEEEPPGRPVEAAVARRMAGRPDRLELAAVDRQALRTFE